MGERWTFVRGHLWRYRRGFAAVVKAIFQYWMRVILIGISRDIRNQIFARLVGLAPDYSGRTRTGDYYGAR